MNISVYTDTWKDGGYRSFSIPAPIRCACSGESTSTSNVIGTRYVGIPRRLPSSLSFRFKNRAERRRNGLPEEREEITYGELAAKYVAQSQNERMDWLVDMLNHSVAAFGHVLVRELRPEVIAIWINRLPVAPETKRKVLGQMRAALNRGVAWGYLPQSPARPELVPTPVVRAPEIEPLESWGEVLGVAEACGYYSPLVIFACATGLRPQEWAALRWRDVDFTANTCRVARTVVRGHVKSAGKTDGSLRTIRLQAVATEVLQGLPRPIDRDRLVFPAQQGGFINLHNFGQRTWGKALKEVGLAHRPPKECRHTFASLALAAGADLYWVSRQLGHTNIATTLRYYARFLPEIDQRNIERLDDYAHHAIAAVSETCHAATEGI